MNMFRFGSQPVQQNQMMAPNGLSSGPFGVGAATNDPLSGKMSKSRKSTLSYNKHFVFLQEA